MSSGVLSPALPAAPSARRATRPPLVARVPPWLSALLGVALLLPMLGMGFYVDDHVHQLALEGRLPMRPWALYDFGARADWEAFPYHEAAFPWWTGEGWKARFLRPVASAWLWLCHGLFGRWALGYHLAQLLLFAWLVVLAHGLYRTWGLGKHEARAGALMLALADAAVLPAGWIANVNALLAALFAVLALRLLAPRAELGPARLALALLLATASALSNESGAATLLLAGGALALRAHVVRGAERRRLAAAAIACGALLAGYAAVYVAGGYGTRSAFYATPWGDPAHFARNLALLVSGGAASLAGPFPLDVASLAPRLAWAVALTGALLGWPLAAWVWRSVRGAPAAGLLAAWTLVFLAPQAGAPPADRMLFAPSIGAAGLLGAFLVARARMRPRASRAARTAAALVALAATVGSGAWMLAQAVGLREGARFLRRSARATEVGDPALGPREALVLQSESQMQAFALGSTWAVESADHAVRFHLLQMGPRPLRWARTGEASFELESLGAPFLAEPFELPYLSDRAPIAPGTRWSTPDFDVEARASDGGRPTRLRFELRRSLDDPAVVFLRPRGGRLARVAPPALGASVELPVPKRHGPYMP